MNVQALTDRLFEVAYFWRLAPSALMAMSLSEFNLYEKQAERLAQQMQPE